MTCSGRWYVGKSYGIIVSSEDFKRHHVFLLTLLHCCHLNKKTNLLVVLVWGKWKKQASASRLLQLSLNPNAAQRRCVLRASLEAGRRKTNVAAVSCPGGRVGCYEAKTGSLWSSLNDTIIDFYFLSYYLFLKCIGMSLLYTFRGKE